MKKNKIIYSLCLVGLISCSNFKPYVLTDAFLTPETTTSGVRYNDLNFSYALFNQYASGLDFKFRINYSNGLSATDRNNAIFYQDIATGVYPFTNWTTITSTFAEGELDATWKNLVKNTLFNRDFDTVSKLASLDERIVFRKIGNSNNTSLEIIMESSISYNVNVGSLYQAFFTNGNQNITSMEQFVSFFNETKLLNTFRLENNPTSTFIALDRLYNFSTVITNVNQFNIMYRWVDVPPYVVTADNFFVIKEFNLFTQSQEVNIPDDPTGDRFGFVFVAVEWWNLFGHLQNFTWWIFNQSPVAPLFQFIEDYVLVWISGLITFITGIFRL